MTEYTITPITLAPWSDKPRLAYSVDCPSPDGYKTRAARLIGDGLKCAWSLRRKYTVSPRKLAKFLELYEAGWDANVISRELIPPRH